MAHEDPLSTTELINGLRDDIRIRDEHITLLEQEIDRLNRQVPAIPAGLELHSKDWIRHLEHKAECYHDLLDRLTTTSTELPTHVRMGITMIRKALADWDQGYLGGQDIRMKQAILAVLDALSPPPVGVHVGDQAPAINPTTIEPDRPF